MGLPLVLRLKQQHLQRVLLLETVGSGQEHEHGVGHLRAYGTNQAQIRRSAEEFQAKENKGTEYRRQAWHFAELRELMNPFQCSLCGEGLARGEADQKRGDGETRVRLGEEAEEQWSLLQDLLLQLVALSNV